MAAHKKLESTDKDFEFKPYLSSVKKISGRIVHEELEAPTFGEEEAMDSLLVGVDADEVEEGRDRLLSENPQLASKQIHNMLDEEAESMDLDAIGTQFNDPKRMASTKRVGKLADKETGDTINFKRINANSQIELTDNNDELLDTLSTIEFDQLLDSGEYIIL